MSNEKQNGNIFVHQIAQFTNLCKDKGLINTLTQCRTDRTPHTHRCEIKTGDTPQSDQTDRKRTDNIGHLLPWHYRHGDKTTVNLYSY